MDKINKNLFNPNLLSSRSGLLVPKWTMQQKPVSDLEKDMLTYSTFKELFPNEINSKSIIQKEFSEFWLYVK